MKNKIKNWEKELEEKVLKHELGGKEDFCYDKKEIEDFIRQLLAQERAKWAEDLLKCPNCGKKLKNVKDRKTGKISKYLFGCKCNPNKVFSKG